MEEYHDRRSLLQIGDLDCNDDEYLDLIFGEDLDYTCSGDPDLNADEDFSYNADEDLDSNADQDLHLNADQNLNFNVDDVLASFAVVGLDSTLQNKRRKLVSKKWYFQN